MKRLLDGLYKKLYIILREMHKFLQKLINLIAFKWRVESGGSFVLTVKQQLVGVVYSESKKSRKKSLEWEVMIEESKRGEWKMYMWDREKEKERGEGEGNEERKEKGYVYNVV